MKSVTYLYSLEIKSPVHIGCGEVYEPTGFVVNRKEKKLVAFEPEEFLAGLAPEELDRFSAICRKGTVQSLHEIYKFMNSKSETTQGRTVAVSDGFVENHTQTLETAPNRIEKELNKFQISRTAFGCLDNLPYIPGSTIKGAMRTGVLNMRYGQRPATAARSASEIEKTLLGGVFDTDPFRLVKVSDFVAVGETHRQIVYAVNKKKKPTDKDSRGIPQILEVIEPGSRFLGTVTIIEPNEKAGVRFPLTIEELHQALTGFYGSEMRREGQELEKINIPAPQLDRKIENEVPLRVGRHCGAESLTIDGRREIRIMLGGGRPAAKADHATTLWLAAGSRNPTSGMRPFGWIGLTKLSEEEGALLRSEVRSGHYQWLTGQRQDLADYRQHLAEIREELQEAERRAAQEAEKERQEAIEKERYPWRELYPFLMAQSDWGGLKAHVLESETFLQFQKINELAMRVAEKAKEIAVNNRKKWDHERELLVRTWLQPSGIEWRSGLLAESVESPTLTESQQELLNRISSCTDWGQYQENPIPVADLDQVSGGALREKFMVWGCAERSAKKPKKKAWKELQAHLKSLK